MTAHEYTNIHYETDGEVAIVTIDRPSFRNACDWVTGGELYSAFRRFEDDDALTIAILTGADGIFCAGADLKSASGAGPRPPAGRDPAIAPMGPSRILLGKPVIAAVEGYAVAGGLELALWCDMRVAADDAVFGVFCRRWGIPLVDGGTVRLPRVVGTGNAMDMILTGRGVSGAEAQRMGLANRLVPKGQALAAAIDLAHSIAAFPQGALRADRRSAYEQESLSLDEALANEIEVSRALIAAGETRAGAARFASGEGRHGTLADGSRL